MAKKESKDKRDFIIGILTIVILVLLIVMIYALVLKPAIMNKKAEKFNQAYQRGVEDAVAYLWNTVNANGYAEVRNGNESMILVPYQGVAVDA